MKEQQITEEEAMYLIRSGFKIKGFDHLEDERMKEPKVLNVIQAVAIVLLIEFLTAMVFIFAL